MTLVLVGTSHQLAPVEVRERVALGGELAAELAGRLAAGGAEAVCLSTCNRTELYLVDGDRAEEEARSAFVELAETDLEGRLYTLADGAAALHLFRVAAGLDSLVPGEGEILGQVRSAFERGRPGMLLDRLFRQALHIGKRVRTETAIGESPTSVPAASAALAQQVFGDLTDRHVLVIGAGRMGEQLARNLAARGARIEALVTRRPDATRELADALGARVVDTTQLSEELAQADVVVSSTSAPGFVLTKQDVAAALPGRRGLPLFFLDIAVPRDIDPRVNELDACYLYDIDDLRAVVAESIAGRRRESVQAEELVAREAERFVAWLSTLDVVPAIALLHARAEEIRRGELDRAEARLGELSARERRAVESVTAGIVNKLLHLPTVRMKEAAAGTDGVLYADAVRHLFGLGEDRPKP